MVKKATTMRFSDTAKELLEKLAQKKGLSQAGILELAIRELAKKERIKLPETEK